MAKNTSIHMETESDTDFSDYFINSFFFFFFFFSTKHPPSHEAMLGQ